jgi:hypothetical protein
VRLQFAPFFALYLGGCVIEREIAPAPPPPPTPLPLLAPLLLDSNGDYVTLDGRVFTCVRARLARAIPPCRNGETLIERRPAGQ